MPDFDLDDDGDAVALAQAHAEALDEEEEWFMMTPEVLEQEPLFEAASRRSPTRTRPSRR